MPAQVGLVGYISPRRKANKAELAEFFGVSVATVEVWLRRGMPVLQHGKKGTPWVCDLLAVARWRFNPGSTQESPGTFDPALLPPKERKDWFDSEDRRIKIEREAGRLIPDHDVHRRMAEMLKSVTNTLDTLPDVLERDAGIGGAAVERAQVVVDRLRESLYRRLTEAGGVAA